MTIIIENASEDLAKVIKGIAKIGNSKCKISKDNKAREWKKESEEMIRDYKAGKIKAYDSAKEMHKEILEDA
ncbi:hypothetical protein [Helicobacter cappadocius]|uniref:Uncharacterized protein n=1 Tax=Helicobacter cappadocius TaxID=3063998 RepID=A0AA90PK32_9HELI|nr:MULTISPECIES: hypothetical protein [unclassified Helicobacter]MDO7253444.1 hypothetical protein [Helicobacter sp. faydin-H75]MDP2539371.1 hypothetical protein [Helicobacter sp. faydin-H76]